MVTLIKSFRARMLPGLESYPTHLSDEQECTEDGRRSLLLKSCGCDLLFARKPISPGRVC